MMNIWRKLLSVLVFTAVVFLLMCCNLASEPQDIVITFDGESCMYQGPKSIAEGEWIITLNNETDSEIILDVVRHEEGKTWQDTIDHIGEPGSNDHRAPWHTAPIQAMVPDNPNATEYTFKEGIYGIVCVQLEPHGVWPGAALEVKGK